MSCRADTAPPRHQRFFSRPGLRRFLALSVLSLAAISSLAQADPPSQPSPAPAPSARAGLDKALGDLTRRVTALGGKLGLCILDVQNGAALAEINPKLALNPASTMKLLTTAALLDRLGPQARFTTSLHGVRKGTEVPELVLRGRGDPSLRTTDLLRMALSLRNSGVTKVGEILVDQSYFDAQFVPPAFDQQPDEWAPFRAPVSAVALDGNTLTLNVMPGSPGAPAHIWFEPEGLATISGQVMTHAPNSKQNIGWTLRPSQGLLSADLGGSIASNLGRQRFKKRVHDPRLLPGFALKRLLKDIGVEVGDRVSEGGAQVEATLIYNESEPLSELLSTLGKESDNFYAEMLLKVLGAKASGGIGTSAAGSQAVLAWLEQAGASLPGTRIVNGSGLFDANRVSAWTLSRALRSIYLDPKLQPEFTSQLSIAGVDGTLKSRLTSFAPTRALRAKTGTLDSTVALSGYLLRDGQPPIIFSMIVDGVRGHQTELRQLFDALVTRLAK